MPLAMSWHDPSVMNAQGVHSPASTIAVAASLLLLLLLLLATLVSTLVSTLVPMKLPESALALLAT